MTEALTLLWYHYSQNNSGGYFIDDEMVCEDVYIQAANREEADAKARELFDDRSDYCPCCGERWYLDAISDMGTAQPEMYGEILWNWEKSWYREKAKLHFWDGRVETYSYGNPRIE